ncbi:uncharacterized protein LOC123879301 [Maniola jurtina]|uniref:uncharacterized protein LOC123879301 n=1 Tax=Maniola jurtina TaxID=191418 RepID=UPI001E68CC3E|nr:uncharacterized protein LOC123879301 [Maniola jurtina]
MPRHYIRKSNRGMSYTQEDVQSAIASIREGRSTLYAAARTYNIPTSTLYDRLHNKTRVASQTLGRRTVIPYEAEQRLANAFIVLEKWGFRLSRKDVMQMVGEFVQRSNIETPFKNGIPGVEWCSNFQQRHGLSLKKAQPGDYLKRRMADPFVIAEYFNLLKVTLRKLRLKNYPHRIWNLSVTSVALDSSKTKDKKETMEGRRKSCSQNIYATGGENITVLTTVNAEGKSLTPLIVFKGKYVLDKWMAEEKDGYDFELAYAASGKGRMETEVFLNYIKKIVVPGLGRERPALFVYDGDTTNIDVNVVELAKSHDVTILKLPPYTTHLLQPLHCAAFKSLKSKWDAELLKWQYDIDENIPKKEFSELFAEIWSKIKPEIIVNGFNATGIFPFNSDAVSKDNFDPKAYKRWLESKSQNEDQMLDNPDSLYNLCVNIVNTCLHTPAVEPIELTPKLSDATTLNIVIESEKSNLSSGVKCENDLPEGLQSNICVSPSTPVPFASFQSSGSHPLPQTDPAYYSIRKDASGKFYKSTPGRVKNQKKKQLPNDMANYMQYRIQGIKKIRMNEGCLPSRFTCQPDRRRTAQKSNSKSKSFIQNYIQIKEEIKDTPTPIENSSASQGKSIQVKHPTPASAASSHSSTDEADSDSDGLIEDPSDISDFLVFNQAAAARAADQPSTSAEELQYQTSRFSMVSGNDGNQSTLEEIIIKEEITDEEKNQCRLCLSVGRRMQELAEYAPLYRKLLFESNYQNTTIPSFMYQMMACWECHAELRKIKRFQDKVRRANAAFETSQNQKGENLSNLSTILIMGEQKHRDRTELPSSVEECAQGIKEEAVEIEVEETPLPDPLEVGQEKSQQELEISVPTKKVAKRTIPEPKTTQNVQKRAKVDQSTAQSGPKRAKLDQSGPKPAQEEENEPKSTPESEVDAIFGKVKIEIDELQKILEERRNKESFKSMKFKCDSCVLGFTDHNRLLEHNKNFHDNEVGSCQCDICERRFDDENLLSAHYRNHFVKFVCKLCNFECYTKTGRAIHFKRHKGTLQGTSLESLLKQKRTFGQRASASGSSHETST